MIRVPSSMKDQLHRILKGWRKPLRDASRTKTTGAYIVAASVVVAVVSFSFGITGDSSAARFKNANEQEQRKMLNSIINAQGPVAAWAFLKKILISGDQITDAENAHVLAHRVGEALYRKLGSQGILVCDDSFVDGCYHGFLSAMVTAEGLNAVADVSAACKAIESTNHEIRLSCIHGAGHGLDEFEKYDLHAALSDCDAFFADKAFDCWEGVFMDNTWFKGQRHPAEVPTWTYCDGLPARYGVACAASLPLWLNRVQEKRNIFSIVRFCEGAKTSAMTDHCLFLLGQIIARNVEGNADEVIRVCTSFPTSKTRDDCLLTAIQLIQSKRYVGWKQNAGAICERVSDVNRSSCTSPGIIRS